LLRKVTNEPSETELAEATGIEGLAGDTGTVEVLGAVAVVYICCIVDPMLVLECAVNVAAVIVPFPSAAP
jgi:hypothetical protein